MKGMLRWHPKTVTLCATGALILAYSCGEAALKQLEAPNQSSSVESGAHWANPKDFAELKRLGHQFAVVSLDRNQDHWREVFDAAEAAGIRLIPGLHPYPYRLDNGHWEIEPAGRQFIQYARERSTLVKALFVFNEPYWVDPATGDNSPCGAFSAAELRELRNEIHRAWPKAAIYHDLGRPSLWAPGGSMERDYRCVGNRYADATGIADFAGIWYYPVNRGAEYRREELVRSIREEVAYVSQSMKAEPIVLGQAFRCDQCADATRMPNVDEIRDLNCTLRWIAPQAISWYSWRLPGYPDSLANHRELWEATGPRGCPANRGS